MVSSKSTLKRLIPCIMVVFSFTQIIAQGLNDYYKIETIQIPKQISLEVGGIDFNDKGNLGVSTRRGELWLIDNPKSNTPNFKLFAQGMHENLGLAYHKGSFYSTQRGELTKLTDTNNDNEADLYESIAQWELSGNYHEYSYGPEISPDGNMYVTLNLAWSGGGKSFKKWRGWMLEINSKGKITPFATGMRSPAGYGFNKNGDLFYADNQGDWVGSGRVTHVEKGDFVGHPEGLKWTKEEGSPLKLNYKDVPNTGKALYDQQNEIPNLKPPSVWFPHTLMGVSTSDIKLIPEEFGPYTNQLLVGDQGHSKIMRMSQEKVNGVYQGACFPFIEGFQSGILRLRWSADNDLYVGMTSRGWPSVGKDPFGLQRVEWNGKTPFDIQHIAVTSNGFQLEFTKPLDENTAYKIENYTITDFNYKYHQTYGSPIINKEKRTIQKVEISSDGMKAKLYLDDMRLGYIYQIKVSNVLSSDQKKLDNNTGYYTLNQLPGGKAFVPLLKSSNGIENSVTSYKSDKRITEKPGNWSNKEITSISITTKPGLKFSKRLIEVKAGTKVRLTFVNPDDMLHNFLLVKPNTVDKVVKKAFELGLDGVDQQYVPRMKEVLYHTNLLQPETDETIYFQVPQQKGDYTYVCTFPGHGQVMRGVLRVK